MICGYLHLFVVKMNEHCAVGMLLDLVTIPSVSFMTILPVANEVRHLSLDKVVERAILWP